MSSVFLGMFKRSFREFDPEWDRKSLCGPKLLQGAPLFSYKAVYEAAALKEDIVRMRMVHQREAEVAKDAQEELKDRLEALDNIGAERVNSLEAHLEEKEVHLTQVTEELSSLRDDLAEEQHKVEELKSTCTGLEDQVQQLRDAQAAIETEHLHLQVALRAAQQEVAEGEGRRKIIANLNSSLMMQSSAKKSLMQKRLRVEKALKGAAERLDELEADKVASQNVITRAFEELVEARNAFETDKYALQTEVIGLRKEIQTLEARIEASTEAQRDITEQLSAAQDELTSSQARRAELEANIAALQDDFDALDASYSTIVTEKQDLEHALHLEREKSRQLEAQLAEADDVHATELAEANAQFIIKFAEHTDLLEAAHQRAVDAECELNDLKVIQSQSAANEQEVILGLELERDMYQYQYEDAEGALEAEGKKLIAMEKERDAYRKLEVDSLAAVKANEEARIAAEEERDSIAARLEDALAQITDLVSQVRKEQDVNAAICSQLSTECEAHANARDDLQSLQTRLAIVSKEKDKFKQTLQAVDYELQHSREIHHSLATTNKTLSRDIAEKNKLIEMLEIQTRCQPATDEEAQTIMAELVKENVALKASKKSIEVALAGKVERCEALEKEVHQFRSQPATSSPVPQTPRVSTPAKAASGDKENAAPIPQASLPPRSSSVPFGITSTSNTSGSPSLTRSASVAGSRQTSSSIFKYFMKKNVQVKLQEQNAPDGTTSPCDSPILY